MNVTYKNITPCNVAVLLNMYMLQILKDLKEAEI
jgi:hypothetical protein